MLFSWGFWAYKKQEEYKENALSACFFWAMMHLCAKLERLYKRPTYGQIVESLGPYQEGFEKVFTPYSDFLATTGVMTAGLYNPALYNDPKLLLDYHNLLQVKMMIWSAPAEIKNTIGEHILAAVEERYFLWLTQELDSPSELLYVANTDLIKIIISEKEVRQRYYIEPLKLKLLESTDLPLIEIKHMVRLARAFPGTDEEFWEQLLTGQDSERIKTVVSKLFIRDFENLIESLNQLYHKGPNSFIDNFKDIDSLLHKIDYLLYCFYASRIKLDWNHSKVTQIVEEKTVTVRESLYRRLINTILKPYENTTGLHLHNLDYTIKFLIEDDKTLIQCAVWDQQELIRQLCGSDEQLHISIIERLLSTGINMDRDIKSNKISALEFSYRTADVAVFKALLKWGVNPNLETHFFESSWYYEWKNPERDKLKVLMAPYIIDPRCIIMHNTFVKNPDQIELTSGQKLIVNLLDGSLKIDSETQVIYDLLFEKFANILNYNPIHHTSYKMLLIPSLKEANDAISTTGPFKYYENGTKAWDGTKATGLQQCAALLILCCFKHTALPRIPKGVQKMILCCDNVVPAHRYNYEVTPKRVYEMFEVIEKTQRFTEFKELSKD